MLSNMGIKERAQQLQDEYDACCEEIELSNTAICMGASIEYNRNNIKRCIARINDIRNQANQLGITLLSYQE